MFFIKLMLIILLNETFAYVIQSDIETVILPAWKPTDKKKISLTLKVFGKQIELDLYRDDQTTSTAFKIWIHNAKDKTELSQLNTSSFCYYHHNNHISSAVINFCQEYGWEGFVLLEDDAMEIKPVQDDFAFLTLIDNFCAKNKTNISFGKIYRIKRSLQLFANSSFYNKNLNNFKQKRQVEDTQKKLTIELAVFFDSAAFRSFISIVNENDFELRDMILAYVNNIEAIFHHPSLGVSIDISLVYLEIMQIQPSDMSLTDRGDALFDYFCDYAYASKPKNENNESYWDIALYLTGLNIYKLTRNRKENYELLGLSQLDTVCRKSSDSCVIAEFGSNDYITSGFASSFVAAHQIAHVLGIPHDDVNPCITFDHIMAPYQFRRAQLSWSKCSRNVAKQLWHKKKCLRDRTTPVNATQFAKNHSHYNHLPGRVWNAKAQCEIYYRDKDADVVSLVDICKTLQCETSTQKNFTGPALEGTRCAHEKECQGGRCLPIHKPRYNMRNPYHESDIYPKVWSEWMADSCKSSCLKRSTGVVVKRRRCTVGIYLTAYCKEPYYDVNLCDDSLLCANKTRLPVSRYTEKKCIAFVSRALELNVLNHSILPQAGYQRAHMSWKPWVACAIFCTKYVYYTEPSELPYNCAPSLEIANLDIDPYFPDGTWCHRQDGQDYYCRQHYCLPENYSFNSRAVV